MCHVRRTAYATVVSHTAVRVVDMLNAYSHDNGEPLATDVAEIISPLSVMPSTSRDQYATTQSETTTPFWYL